MVVLKMKYALVVLLGLLIAALTQEVCRDDPRYSRGVCSQLWRRYCDGRQYPIVPNTFCRRTCGTCVSSSSSTSNLDSGVTSACNGAQLSTTSQNDFSKSSMEFAWRLYQQARSQQNGNIFFSPTSISLALGMVMAGARGSTKQSIQSNVVSRVSNSDMNSAFNWLMNELNKEGMVYKLHTANSMYVQQDMQLRDAFSTIVRNCFMSEANAVDFRTNAEPIRLRANRWVESKTANKIKDLIPQGAVDAATRMILVNAIYFKGEWQNMFTDSPSYEGDFWNSAAQTSNKVQYMNQKTSFPYFENNDVQVLGMPYKNNDLTMYIFLPKDRNGLNRLEQSLTAESISSIISQARPQTVDVTIPKFTMTQNLPLKELLMAMGMSEMFTPAADLSGMAGQKGDLYVSDALHKAFIEVNEKGTEAAAATAILISRSMAAINRPIIFRADRPFLFLIRHIATETPLFVGSLVRV